MRPPNRRPKNKALSRPKKRNLRSGRRFQSMALLLVFHRANYLSAILVYLPC
jgi:hypothetical protein